VSPAFDNLLHILKKLPGLGSRSAERICIHLLAEKPEKVEWLINALQDATTQIHRCKQCGNLSKHEVCEICSNQNRDHSRLCIVESISDLMAFEKSGAWNGVYHVLNGRLSPLKGIGPDDLNMEALGDRLISASLSEILFALPNDIEGEATCHYVQERWLNGSDITVSRIGFGLPSGGDIPYADATTLKNALDSRKGFN
jgi:recombination protein RecR